MAMAGFPRRGENFGSGFAQGFGSALQALPGVLIAARRQKQTAEVESLRAKLLEKQIARLSEDPTAAIQKMMSLIGGGGQQAQPQSGTAVPGAPEIQGTEELAPGNEIPMTMPSGAVGVQPEAVPAAKEATGGGDVAGAMTQQQQYVPRPWVNSKGEFGVQYSPKDNFKVDYSSVQVAPGQYRRVATFTDPARPGWMMEKLVPGLPVPASEIQAAQQAAQGLGFTGGGIEHGASMILASKLLPPQARTEAIAQLQREAQTLNAGAGAEGGTEQAPSGAGGLDVAGAASAAQARQAQTAGMVSGAQQSAKNATVPLSGANEVRYNLGQSLERNLSTVQKLYKPEFVGKGFTEFMHALDAEATHSEDDARAGKFGGLGGAVRAFTGNIAPEEATFRKAVVNAQNQLLYSLSGQQINEAEYQRLKRGLFTLTEEPAVFKAGMDAAIKESHQKLEDMLRTHTTPASQLLKQRQGSDVGITLPKGWQIQVNP